MSVFTPKRLFLCIAALLAGTAAYAGHPSPRTLARMAYDPQTQVSVLFGGRGHVDRGGTASSHASNETWLFAGTNWAQRFPATTPPGRSTQAMTYDSQARRVVMFGGRQEPADTRADPTLLDDLWAYQNDNWTRLDGNSAQRPSQRQYASMAFDPDRNRLVLYGGFVMGGRNNREEVPVYDTWEFSGTNWTRTTLDAPKVAKPVLAYDAANKQMIMLGVDQAAKNAPLMYRYDGTAWHQVNAPKLPTCVNEGHLVYQTHTSRLLFLGGVCTTGTSTTEEAWEFDGETWNKLTIAVSNKGIGQAVTYDASRKRVVFFGGTDLITQQLSSYTYAYQDGAWHSVEAYVRPGPRSQMVFATSAASNSILLYGGLEESSTGDFLGDSWAYRDGLWSTPADAANSPVGCEYPLGAFDTDRQTLVVNCGGANVWEYDGAKWKEFSKLDPQPDARRFASMVYDQKMKKVVLFGGYLGDSYRNDTWTWDGAKWAEVKADKDHRPPHRGSMAMWYDPLQQKTILYGGIGRPNINTAVTRYGDMWAFDGSRWAKLDVAQTPGSRLRPSVAVNPTTGKLLLFGGLRYEQIDKDSGRQFYADDTWQWDGSTSRWTQLAPATTPPARQNAGLAWDPTTNQMTMFGGNALGFYLSDVWAFDGADWRPRIESLARRGRAVRK